MPRPRKCRIVCCLPEFDRFGPLGTDVDYDNMIKMTVDEYETIRLIDLDGMTQEDCSKQMKVARTTIQGIYNEARKKLAQALVHGKELQIEGGEYRICEGDAKACIKARCPRCGCKNVPIRELNAGNSEG
ncbi:DUF134 domain-containing protein [Parasporobacterium paucivorans]|uniref:UPF0251 protein SAMN02745691_01374 n=1 Tax=Parasporobacterium paucivorans DSM 15970 TaxID=1122934 RepID=A0A1M6GNL3_9FIRM|nr:DUF134 domain-containing protein [Parasporobacterium paucivorans]SHJ11547.1 Predicted DNA-binding protein, UPF0251 family [Parasporobacterium paucivorans DSM 15970]